MERGRAETRGRLSRGDKGPMQVVVVKEEVEEVEVGGDGDGEDQQNGDQRRADLACFAQVSHLLYYIFNYEGSNVAVREGRLLRLHDLIHCY